MNRWEGKVSVVTGASSGIGLAIAETFYRDGLIVVGLARRKDKMENAMKTVKGKGKFYAIKCDVTDEKNVADCFEWIKKNIGVVHIMVNNAGIILNGTIYETSRKDWEKVFNVNVMGLLECTKCAVNIMKEADIEGHIVNINSIEGHSVHFFGPVRFNVYAGAKHAVTGLTETLRMELLGSKIRVTSISPGYVNTDIIGTSNIDVDFSQFPSLESQDIADAVLYVVSTPPRVNIKELIIKPTGEL